MKFKIYEKIEELENLIFKGYKLWIFRGYVAINKRGVEKIIDDIYSTLPIDVMNAKAFLSTEHRTVEPADGEKIYDVLKDLEQLVYQNNFFPNLTIINEKRIKDIEQRLKNSLPEEILNANKADKD